MTENLAARGEGLAGALDLLEKCRPSHFDFSGALVHHEKPSGNELSFDPSCPKCVIPKVIALIRAALEAAAPAGTPGCTLVPDSALRWLFGEEGEFVDPNPAGVRPRPYWWRTELRKRIAALATPSPQAPAEQCQRCGQPDADGGGVFVDKEDALREEWLCGACVSKELRELRMAAATQEPAGSAPHFVPLTPEQVAANEKETVSLASYHEIGGSPRKVGEDELRAEMRAAGEHIGCLDDEIVELREALEKAGGALDLAITMHEKAGCSGETCSYPYDLQKMVRTACRAALARSSSVPVGEQKQEEGV